MAENPVAPQWDNVLVDDATVIDKSFVEIERTNIEEFVDNSVIAVKANIIPLIIALS